MSKNKDNNDNITFLNKATTEGPTVKQVLENALKTEFEDIIVLGWRADSEALYLDGTDMTIADLNWLLDNAKQGLLDISKKS